MLSTTVIKQLLAAQQLQAFSTGASAVAAAAAVAATGHTRHCRVHTSAGQPADAAVEIHDESAAAPSVSHTTWAQQQQQQQGQDWSPARSLPPPSPYGLKITIKAHDLLFVKLASTAIRDLVMVNMAPKSREVLPDVWRGDGVGVPWVNLALPVGDRALPTKRTHFTVISGPHVHKTAREQFARTTHSRVIQVGTNSLDELNWLLHSIKMYKFVGVELSMRISSSSYLLPTSSSQQDAAQQPLLAAHKQRFSHLFGAAAAPSSSSSSSSSSYAGLQDSLQGLRSELHKTLLEQRIQLGGLERYKQWQGTDAGRSAAAAAAAAAAAGGARKLPEQQLQEAVAQQVEGSSLVAAEVDSSSSSSSSGGVSREGALLAALEKLLTGVKAETLDRPKYFPYLMAFYRPGHQSMPAADWMHTLLAYAKHRQQQLTPAAAAAGVTSDTSSSDGSSSAYSGYGGASRAGLLLGLQQWVGAADRDSRRRLGMPGEQTVQDMMPDKARGSSSSSSSVEE